MTAWNREGIPWRSFGAIELLWIAHRFTFEFLKDKHPASVRQYLLDSGDLYLLGQWDSGSFKETDLSTGGSR